MVKKGYLEKAGCRLEHETEGKQGVERTPEKGFKSQWEPRNFSQRGNRLFGALESKSSSGLSLELPHQLLFTSLMFACSNVPMCHLYSALKEMIELCFKQLNCLQSDVCLRLGSDMTVLSMVCKL